MTQHVAAGGGDISQKLTEAMNPHVVWNFQIGGTQIAITDALITMWIVMAVIMILTLILVRKFQAVPQKAQNVIEFLVEMINNSTKGMLHHHWRPYAPYFGTILIFLMFANVISIFNIFPFFHLRPPTKNINITFCMALISIVLVLISGIRYKGFVGWLKSFLEPTPIMLFFKILDYFIRPLSLSLRLFGNILGAFIMMELLYMAMASFIPPVVIPAAFSLYFDIFDGMLQAYIFMFLTSLYIAEAIE